MAGSRPRSIEAGAVSPENQNTGSAATIPTPAGGARREYPEGMKVRPAAVSGLFYPRDPVELAGTVAALLAAADPAAPPAPRALVAPHAGYVYSGPIAASAFRQAEPLVGRVRRVVLLGPSHYVPLDGLALPSAEAFSTPLGAVPLDRRAMAEAARLPGVTIDDAAHAREHSLEVELPFLQRLLGEFELVPFAVGEASAAGVAAVLERLADEETLLVVSSDLSHYLDYDAAVARDRRTSSAILALDADGIGALDACGRVPLTGLLALARARGWRARLLDLRNSGDTAGPSDRVVGYGAYAFA